ncbi:hypothetical protein BS47DRAFT_856903 [Hydnum rufescens UP504]|uniref:Uncharacterized protein n=1 Tax=Hydnum rufescens UP504 TaxID=1448309 RepID=A0A9P6AZ55_9AGAM|nr:hypothetical protein BS47DRAFT_856903 [Hydnum rufescens UP504]
MESHRLGSPRQWSVGCQQRDRNFPFPSLDSEMCESSPWEHLCIKKAAIWVAGVLHGFFVTGPNVRELNSWVRWILALVPG